MRKKFILVMVVVLLLVSSLLINTAQPTKAAMSSFLPVYTDVSEIDVPICLGYDSGLAIDQSLDIVFADEFDITGVIIGDATDLNPTSDIWIYTAADDCTGANIQVVDEDLPADDLPYAVKNGNRITIYSTEVAFTNPWSISIEDRNIKAPATTVAAPAVAGFYQISTYRSDGESSAQLLAVGTDSQIGATGSVERYLSVTFEDWRNFTGTTNSGAPYTCDLGILSSLKVNTCSYSVRVTTNSIGGYLLSLQDNNDGELVSGIYSIAAVADGTVDDGTSEYGVATTDDDTAIAIDVMDDEDSSSAVDQDDCSYLGADVLSDNSGVATAVTASAQSFAKNTVDVADEVTSVCHMASVSGTQAPGLYSTTSTVTVTYNF